MVSTDDFTPQYIQDMQYLMNLELNFVHNTDVRLGEFKTALMAFKNVIRLKPDHAFAHYYAAQCYKGMDDEIRYEEHMKAYATYALTPFWRPYTDYFKLPLPEGESASPVREGLPEMPSTVVTASWI